MDDHAIAKRPKQMKIEKTEKLVYILAASHSGSTLTAMLLNSHPDICTAGELKISNLDSADSYRCSCRKLIQECEYWKRVGEQMASYGLDFDVRNAKMNLLPTRSRYVNRLLRPLHRTPVVESVRDSLLSLSPVWHEHRSDWQRRNRTLISSIASVSNVKYVVDSSKTGVRLKYLLRIPGLDIKVIRLVRDGRAVALTYMDSDNYADARNPAWRGGGTGPTARPRLDMHAAANRWLKSNLDAEAARATVPDENLAVVRYEQLCAEPSATLKDVYSFLGLEFTESFRDFRSATHHVVGNGMRLDDSSDIVLDDRWKSVLTEDDLKEFDAVAGGLNRHYGYS